MRSDQMQSTWMLYSFGKGGTYLPSSTDMGFVFPQWSRKAAFPAFLTTTTDAAILGNLTGKTLSARVSIVATGSVVFVYGGQITGWNTGPYPPSGRIWFSSVATPYTVSDGIANEYRYWWSHEAIFVTSKDLGMVVVSASTNPGQWGSANGHRGDDPICIDRFNAAISGVKQIGISFGGGGSFDVGVGLLPGSGSASFRLESFSI